MCVLIYPLDPDVNPFTLKFLKLKNIHLFFNSPACLFRALLTRLDSRLSIFGSFGPLWDFGFDLFEPLWVFVFGPFGSLWVFTFRSIHSDHSWSLFSVHSNKFRSLFSYLLRSFGQFGPFQVFVVRSSYCFLGALFCCKMVSFDRFDDLFGHSH